MGEDTGIAWTHHTFNPWWGCVEVTDECSRCYARTFAKRTGHDVWGKDGERRTFGDAHWREPLKWDRAAALAGERRRVFCASMADVFEDHPVAQGERPRLFALIEATPNLDWLLLTKRPENMLMMAPVGWSPSWPRNVWAGTSAGSQATADRAIDELVQVPAAVIFVSAEPLLGRLNLRPWLGTECTHEDAYVDHSVNAVECRRCDDARPIDWVIVGGESGPKHREMCLPDAVDLVRQCREAGVACFVKQDSGPRPGDRGRLPLDAWETKQFPTQP